MNIVIRNAVPEDCGRIRPLQEEIARLHYNGRPDLFKNKARYFTREAFEARLNDPRHTVYIAEVNGGEIVGYAFAWIVSYMNHSTYVDFDAFYIDDICVSKKYRRNGIGTRLFGYCKQKAIEQKCKIIDLGVYAFNREAVAFYESCGMTERIRRMEYRLEAEK